MSTLLDLARRGQPMPFECIDMHGHLGRYEFAIPDLSPDALIRSMNALGVGRYWTSHMRCMSADVEWGNDEVYAAMQQFPGRILGAVSVWPGNTATVEARARHWLSCGFSGFKLHNCNGFAYNDAAYEPVYRLANQHRMPILFHTWGGAREFKELFEVAKTCPEAALLLAHSGSADTEAYIRMALECPNVYLDLALSRSPRGLVAELVKAVGADRVVWGSDAVFMSNTQQIGKVLGADIPDDAKRRVLADNAAGLLARIRR
ncbi:MAG: hypothetical protein A2498_14610 [Lentisphaerae bacterium RIFOXYC12_FULL_60_16]|nr:MAG: hypothetical protein A2498_14610 [Lentisphaerae bacterium RIFOXYC12_FULL_60_16]